MLISKLNEMLLVGVWQWMMVMKVSKKEGRRKEADGGGVEYSSWGEKYPYLVITHGFVLFFFLKLHDFVCLFFCQVHLPICKLTKLEAH